MTGNTSDADKIKNNLDEEISAGSDDPFEEDPRFNRKSVFDEATERVEMPATEEELLSAIEDVLQERRRQRISRTAPQAA